MRRDDALQLLNTQATRLRQQYGLKSLSLFGSVARDEAGPRSDVDVLVEFDGPVDLLRFMDCRFDLESVLGCRVDLVMASAVKASRRPHIEAELLRVA